MCLLKTSPPPQTRGINAGEEFLWNLAAHSVHPQHSGYGLSLIFLVLGQVKKKNQQNQPKAV